MNRLLWAVMIAMWPASAALGQGPGPDHPDVTVEGTNVNGIVFTWDVTNHTDEAINYFAVPVFGVNTFDHPEGWRIANEPRLQQGDFILETDRYAAMILRNRALQFRCSRTVRDVPHDGHVTVTVGFEDGRRVEVSGVLAPVAPSTAKNLLLPVFLGVLLLIGFAVKVRKDRRKVASAGAGGHSRANEQ
ncbi:MAG: hypothetical protein JSU68_13055 [Phycisphaerales bacterium]|nr:MAG: hypothetical protein JSU68_13055 [Phycisphaerales bacterium]